MKILYFTSNPLPSKKANRTQVIKMCEALSCYAEVTLVLEEIKENIKERYNIKKEFETIELKYKRRLKFLVYSWKLRKLLKEVQPDVIFIRDNYLLFGYTFLKRLGFIKNNPKLITEIQGIYALNFLSRKIASLNNIVLRSNFLQKIKLKNIISGFLNKLHKILGFNFISRWFDRFNLTKVDFFIFFTKYLRDYYLQNYNLNPKGIIILPNGIDLDMFNIKLSQAEAREEINLPLDKQIIGWLGNFKEQKIDKGLINIFKAAQRLNNPNYLFMIIGGDKRDVKEYKEAAKYFGVESQIKFTGFVDFNKVPIYLRALDLALMPFSWTEHYAYHMCPRKLFDYLAAGLPLISSDLPSIKTVLNNKNCIFCKPGDSEDLAQKIDYILNNPKVKNEIVKHAQEDIKKYTWENRAQKIFELINNKLL